jgi:hypothetical protein
VSPASSLTSRQAGCLTAVLTESTVPGTGQLSGTVFAVPVSLPAQQVSFASANPSPVAVGSKYDPVARSSAGLAVKLVVSAASTKGTCSIAAGGVVAFTGVGMCVVEAEQDGSASWAAAVASQSIVVSRGRPVAVKASYAVDYRHALAVTVRDGILAKDTLNGAVLVSHTRPAHGALSLRANGAFTYVPRPSFSGTDGFTYTVKNSLGRATASVTIHVGPPPAPGTGGRR